MNKYYFLYLYKQYCNSIGKEFNKLNLFNDEDFIYWVIQRNKQTNIYKSYIETIGIKLEHSYDIEIGKGKYDSLGKENVLMISPFAETSGLPKSNLIFYNEEPLIITDSAIYSIFEYTSFFIHNPFFKEDIRNIVIAHNMGFNICFGIYGNNSDKDKNKKLEMLKESTENMKNDFEFNYETEDTSYYACLISKRKIKRKVLIK